MAFALSSAVGVRQAPATRSASRASRRAVSARARGVAPSAQTAARVSQFVATPGFSAAARLTGERRVLPWNRAHGVVAAAAGPRTLFDKIWDDHVVDCQADGTCLIYIDRHLVHEVTSPQAFEGLRTAGRAVRQPGNTLATADHNVPTSDRSMFENVATFIKEAESRTQVSSLSGGRGVGDSPLWSLAGSPDESEPARPIGIDLG